MLRSEFLIGATKSGSGKTLLTVGIIAALAKRGIDVQPFKCGPDFIDPTLHELVVGRPSINLDLHMMGEKGCLASHEKYAENAEAVVVEGVMGLFDGGSSSSASLAKLLDVPVVLIVDVRSAAESVAAVIKGFELYNPEVNICGVICNRIGSKRHRQLIEDAVRVSCRSEILGFFPRDVQFEMPSRHLGLLMGHESEGIQKSLGKLVDTIEEFINLDRLLELSQKTSKKQSEVEIFEPFGPPIRLAVARDEAFCFYYKENFDLLASAGFEIVPFSPLHDTKLPENIAGVYLGGGYPELYARSLSENHSMLRSMLKWFQGNGFIYGECGGFMYMTRGIIDLNGVSFPMSGIFPITVKMKNRLSRLGYRRASICQDCPIGSQDEAVYGHEFHYSDIVERSDDLQYLYRIGNEREEGCRQKNAMGSYIHLHFAQSKSNLKRLYTFLNSQ